MTNLPYWQTKQRQCSTGGVWANTTVYDSNQYFARLENPTDEGLKVMIYGVPLSVDDSSVLEMLSLVRDLKAIYNVKKRN